MGLGSRAEPKWAPGAWGGGHRYCCSGLWVLPGQRSLLEGLLSSPPSSAAQKCVMSERCDHSALQLSQGLR